MVWAGISAQEKTNLHIIEHGTLTTVRYVNVILDVHVRTYAGAVSPDFVLMDDNAVHTEPTSQTDILRRQLKSACIGQRGPRIYNPIEYALDMLQKAISSRHVQQTIVQELTYAIIEEWAQITQHKVRKLNSSMWRRCQAVIYTILGIKHPTPTIT
jgi:hypothetical protein